MDSQNFGNSNANINNPSNDDQLENLSNLLMNSGPAATTGGGGGVANAETAIIEQFEYEMDKQLNENLINEKEQMNQRLFQSFQTSACTVAQMFKDKSTLAQQSQLGSWQSFQNAAGAITVLYKDSLESCKTHYELGIAAGQQRKLKEVLGWLKKKKRRTIRKEELLSFLLGRQLLMGDEMMNAGTNTSTMGSVMETGGGGSTAGLMMSGTGSSSLMFPSKQPFLFRQQSQQLAGAQQQQTASAAAAQFFGRPTAQTNPTCVVAGADTSSDLATFREALIMHNRSRDHNMPPPPSSTTTTTTTTFPTSHLHAFASSTTNTAATNNTSSSHHNNHLSHHHHHLNHNNLHSQQQQQHHHHHAQTQACDDLDCFFCEQIATHVDHKRSASQISNLNGGNFDMESPTRKRGRFY